MKLEGNKMYSKSDYTAVMSRSDSGWPKYGNPSSFEKVINHQLKHQFIPSKVSLLRAIKELGLRRVDGGSAASDQRAAEQQAQQRINEAVQQAQSIPLTNEEMLEFGSLSAQDLSRRCEEDVWFRARYDIAIRTWGFRPPMRFAAAQTDEGEALALSPAEYRAIPAQVTTRRYMQEPAFKRSVDELIRRGLI
jgi:hypothetical protein